MTVLWAMLRHTANRHDEPSRTVLTRLARHRIDWTAHDLSFLLRCLTEHDDTYYAEAAHRTALTACEQVDDAVLRQCEQHVRTLHRRHGGAEHQGYAAHRRIGARLDRLVERLDGVPTGARERFGADVGPLLAAEIPDTMDSPDLAELLALCAQIRTVRPNRRWRDRAAALLAERPSLPGEVRAVLEQVPRLADVLHAHLDDFGFTAETPVLLLRGLLWSTAGLPPEQAEWVAPLLGDIACHAGTGPGGSKVVRAERLAVTALDVLGVRGDAAAVAALTRAVATVRKKTVLAAARRALDAAAERNGLTPDDLMDRTVPDHGLGPDGTREESLGGHTAVLGIGADGSPALTFRTPAGRTVRTPPKAVREEHGPRLRELRAELKELKALLPVQRRRLEAALGEGRTWAPDSWARYVMDHSATGHHARRLVWEASTDGGRTWRAGLPGRDGPRWLLREAAGAEVFDAAGAGEALLRLWHPVRATADAVRAWRDHLVAAGLVQPVRQAFREVYLLTPAERTTRVHSHRHAAHILRYGQAKALLGSRGWRGPQPGYGDGGESGQARRVYRDAATGREGQATFVVNLVEREEDRHLSVSYCSSGPVWFTPVGGGRPRPAGAGAAPGVLRGDARRGPGHRRGLHRRRPRVGPPRGAAPPRLLAAHRVRRPHRVRRDAPRRAAPPGAPAADRRPAGGDRPLPAGPRRPAHLPDPPGVGEHPHGTRRLLPVRRGRARRHRRAVPAVRGRRGTAVADPVQGVPAGRRHRDHRPRHRPPDPGRR